MKKLNRILRGLIYVLPAVLFFSYYPVISLGSSETMNFELSLPILWLLVFDFIGFLILVFEKKLFSGVRRWWWGLLFPTFATLSLIWSENLVRGVLTCGILWLVLFAVYVILSLREKFYDERGFSYVFLKVFLASSVLICLWCVAQCVMDVLGASREVTLLCPGCVYQMFGFPHPNGFAIEPQFMGNLLLAPVLISGYFVLKNRKYLLLFFIFVAALFLTFSRGAIYAFVIGMIFMSVALFVKKIGFKKIAMMWGVVVLSFVFTLNLQGVLAQVSPTNDTYISGVSKVLNHLSLGIIDIRAGTDEEVGNNVGDDEVVERDENEAVFDGYVEESTNVRMELTKNAVKVWSRDFRTMMFGVGIGGAGQAMYDAGLTGSPKEIVQNEYASLLLETGIVGVIIVIIVVLMILKNIRKNPVSIIILSLMVSYGVSLMFFSGMVNALQIYLLPPVIYIVLRKKLVS